MKITVEIKDKDGWFTSGGPVMPRNLDYCIVVYHYGDKTPVIGQWIEAENCWVNMSDAFLLSADDAIEDWEPGYIHPEVASIWKPLGLPPEMDAQLKKTVNSWFGEETEE